MRRCFVDMSAFSFVPFFQHLPTKTISREEVGHSQLHNVNNKGPLVYGRKKDKKKQKTSKITSVSTVSFLRVASFSY